MRRLSANPEAIQPLGQRGDGVALHVDEALHAGRHELLCSDPSDFQPRCTGTLVRGQTS